MLIVTVKPGHIERLLPFLFLAGGPALTGMGPITSSSSSPSPWPAQSSGKLALIDCSFLAFFHSTNDLFLFF